MHSYSSKGKYNNQKRNEQPSRVLLVCVYDTIILEITNQAVYQRFNRFGSIIKILIFERGEVTKFFIEFSKVHQAENAKNALDGAKLYESICKMNIYFSNFSNVDLRHETSEGANFELQEQIKSYFTSTYEMLHQQNQLQNYDFINDESLMHSFNSFGVNSRSKTDDPRILEEFIKRSQFNAQTQKASYEAVEIEEHIENNINTLLEGSKIKEKAKQLSINNCNTYSVQLMKTVKIKEESVVKNSFLCFELKENIPIRNIYNVFSNFGNISLIKKTKDRAFLKFRTIEFAAIANNYLNDTILMGNLLALEPVNDPSSGHPHEDEYSESIFYDDSFDRFTSQKSITINPPSRTLHVSSIKKDICRYQSLRKIFDQYGTIEAIQILSHSSQKNMALVKFYSIEDSFYAISELHNRFISGRKIQISFTKSKLL